MSSTGDKELTLAEQAAAALKEAAEAEHRAQELRQTQQPKTSSPPPKTEITPPKAEVYTAEDSKKVASELASEIGKLQRSAGNPDPLSGTRWLLRLDFGREEGTWMDARWGASGNRVKAVVAVELLEGGQVQVVEDYNYGLLLQLPKVKGGKWRVEGSFPSERLKFELEHNGLTKDVTRCDVDVPEGKLFLSVNTLGTSVGKQGGLSIEQFRFYVRRERRMVGVFRAERLE